MTKKRDSELKERLKALKVNEPLRLKSELTFKPPQSQNEVPQIEAPLLHPAQVEQPQFKESQKAIPQNEAAQICLTQNELPQSEKPLREVPQAEVPQKEVGGFFKLSHRAFFDPTLRELSGDCFRLFLWLSSRAWRFSTSDGTVRASVSYIETQAGMSHATISRALKTLREKKLVTLKETDFKKGNLWHVSPIASTSSSPDPEPEDEKPQKKVAQNEVPQTSVQAASIRGSESLKVRQLLPQNEADLRSFKKNKKFKEVPVAAISLPPSQPNETDSGEALQAFETELEENSQKRVVSAFVEKEFPHGFFPPMRVIRTMAAKDWFRSQAAHVYATA